MLENGDLSVEHPMVDYTPPQVRFLQFFHRSMCFSLVFRQANISFSKKEFCVSVFQSALEGSRDLGALKEGSTVLVCIETTTGNLAGLGRYIFFGRGFTLLPETLKYTS